MYYQPTLDAVNQKKLNTELGVQKNEIEEFAFLKEMQEKNKRVTVLHRKTVSFGLRIRLRSYSLLIVNCFAVI